MELLEDVPAVMPDFELDALALEKIPAMPIL